MRYVHVFVTNNGYGRLQKSAGNQCPIVNYCLILLYSMYSSLMEEGHTSTSLLTQTLKSLALSISLVYAVYNTSTANFYTTEKTDFAKSKTWHAQLIIVRTLSILLYFSLKLIIMKSLTT